MSRTSVVRGALFFDWLVAFSVLAPGCAEIIDVEGTYHEVACLPGSERACYTGPAGTEGVGLCRAGTATCNAAGTEYGPCVGERLPACEDCATAEDESCDGQPLCQGEHRWSKRFGDAARQEVVGLAVDGNGDVLVTGTFFGSIDFGGGPLVSEGGQDIFLAKLDASGAHLWSKRFGDGEDNGFARVAVDPTGHVLVSGQLRGTVDFGCGALPSAGGGDAYVARLTPSGECLWSRRFGNEKDDDVKAVPVGSDGEVAVVLTPDGPVDLGDGFIGYDGWHIVLARFDADGNTLWSDSRGPGYSVILDATGGGELSILIPTAVDIDVGGGLLDAEGATNTVIARYGPDGAHLWSRIFPSEEQVYPRRLELVSDAGGSLFVAGNLYGSTSYGGGPLTAPQGAFFARLDPAGAHVASRAVQDVGEIAGLAVDCRGNLMAGGTSLVVATGAAVDFGGGPLAGPAVIAKLNPALQHVWSKGFGGAEYTSIKAVAADRGGDVLVAGHFKEDIDLGGGPLVSAGDTDVFIARLGP